MITLIAENWLFLLVALIIGLVTAFAIWAGTKDAHSADAFDANDGLLDRANARATAPEPAPVVTAPPPTPEPVPVAPEPKPVAEPVPVPAPKVEPAPKAEPAPTPRPRNKPVVAQAPVPAPPGKPAIAPANGEPDNLRLIKGVGPKLNTMLIGLGITRFDQIATWGAKEIAEVDRYLESFSGRITRDAWIDQAKYLAKDDIAGFEKKYGKL